MIKMPKEITGQIIERIPSTEPYAFIEIKVNVYGDDPGSAVTLLKKTIIELELDEREKPDPKTERKVSNVLTIFEIPKDLRENLKITEDNQHHYVRIKKMLPTEKFKKLAKFLDNKGFEYVSQGTKSHFSKRKK